jgi:WD40 repeat protein
LDPATLNVLPNGILKKVNEKVTCLERANDAPSNVVATAGRDGFIRFWDKRSRQKALEIQSRMSSTHQAQLFTTLTTTTAHKLISALVCDAQRNFIAAGIENPEDGSHESPVYVW